MAFLSGCRALCQLDPQCGVIIWEATLHVLLAATAGASDADFESHRRRALPLAAGAARSLAHARVASAEELSHGLRAALGRVRGCARGGGVIAGAERAQVNRHMHNSHPSHPSTHPPICHTPLSPSQLIIIIIIACFAVSPRCSSFFQAILIEIGADLLGMKSSAAAGEPSCTRALLQCASLREEILAAKLRDA